LKKKKEKKEEEKEKAVYNYINFGSRQSCSCTFTRKGTVMSISDEPNKI